MIKRILLKYFRILHSINDNSNSFNISNDSIINQYSSIIASRFNGNITIGKGVQINNAIINGNFSMDDFSKIIGGEVRIIGEVNIGKNTAINGPDTDLICMLNPIKIGNFCSIARSVLMQEYNHNYKTISTHFINKNVLGGKMKQDIHSKGPIIIKNDVWVGAHVVILSGVTIGNGAIISANSTVTKDVPDYAIVGGTPAKVLSSRFEKNIIEKLLDLKWWDWSYEKIKINKELFIGDITIEKIDRIR